MLSLSEKSWGPGRKLILWPVSEIFKKISKSDVRTCVTGVYVISQRDGLNICYAAMNMWFLENFFWLC